VRRSAECREAENGQRGTHRSGLALHQALPLKQIPAGTSPIAPITSTPESPSKRRPDGFCLAQFALFHGPRSRYTSLQVTG
jgi:hypothetical protein